jgi:hypothetical protein
MKTLFLLTTLSALVLLSGCATRFDLPDPSAEKLTIPSVSFQRAALTPRNGGYVIKAGDLRRGDILLSAADGVNSVGIRLWTLAPVSHAAIYIGEGLVAEAVGEGVRIRALPEMLEHEAVVAAFRHPGMSDEQSAKLRAFALKSVGSSYNHWGILLQAPFAMERRICELPVIPGIVRDFCIRGIALVQLGTVRNDRFFCSQFVLEGYKQAGLSLTEADPRLISPADIMHMREGDVASVKINQTLTYEGHLKFQAPVMPGT